MARLRDHSFRITYGPADDRLRDFYIPALSASVRYDRTAGFFSSDALALAAQGVARLVANGGVMRLLVGAKLEQDDLEAIQTGHSLESRVARQMLAELEHLEEELVRRRLEVLAWMIGAGTLHIKVVLPTGPDGRVLPAHLAQDYYHPKAGIFTDSWGDQVAFNGSINESVRGWVHNYEQFAVYRSWDESRPYLLQEIHRFQRLWEGQEPYWVALPIPQAVKEKLLTLRPDQAPSQDPMEEKLLSAPEAAEAKLGYQVSAADQKERLLFQFVRDAPFFPNASGLGLATCAIRVWPHQEKVVEALVAQFPERFLLADEVGLGKTIEAGLVLRQLWISGRVKRALILAPKSLCKQWQEELYEKFLLNVPIYDGQVFSDYHGRVYAPGRENPWEQFSLLIASSQLAKRRDRAEQLISATPWDLILIDEAHHARRKDFLSGRFRPNRLLELLRGSGGRPGLKDHTQGLILLTATPMQVHPVEVWDLLKILGLSGRWGADEKNFLGYFRELRSDPKEIHWPVILDLLQDYFEAGGTWDEDFCREAEARLGVVTWEQIKSLPSSYRKDLTLKQLSPLAKQFLLEMARRHTPVQRYAYRNTRALLRKYHDKGLLQENVPRRQPELVWIPMRPEEAELYHKVEEYISDFYRKFEDERKGLGFIMTVYRRRLTSSFYALEMSLKRRLEFLTGKPQTGSTFGVVDDDLEQDDLDRDVSELLEPEFTELVQQEIDYIQDLLHELRGFTIESKVKRLKADLEEILKRRETAIIFTQYTDTMDYLRERLLPVYGSQLACYSGRGGERWDGTLWKEVSKEEIKIAFKKGEEIKILLCTEAASEGLNLQTCGVLINYDMPWNPMRVEQRIGRIDRIGQVHPEVLIKNYFYKDTVEATVYQRLEDRIGWFQDVVGELQPILNRIGEVIQKAALSGREAREKLLEEEITKIKEDLQARQVEALNLDELAAFPRISASPLTTPITLRELEDLFLNSATMKDRLKVHGKIPKTYELSWAGEKILVTFDPTTFDEHPQTVRLLSFGEDFFDKIIKEVPEPKEVSERTGIVRCRINQPFPCVAYYDLQHGEPKLVESLAAFKSCLERQDLPRWTPADLEAVKSRFLQYMNSIQEKLHENQSYALRNERRALEEQARIILINAALIDSAIKLEKGDVPEDFSEKLINSIKELRKHKYPFAPLLQSIEIKVNEKISNIIDNFRRIQNENKLSLQKRFHNIKNQAKEILNALYQKNNYIKDKAYISLSDQIDVKIYCPIV